MAAEAWARAGDLVGARAAVARARAAGPLSPTLSASARRIEAVAIIPWTASQHQWKEIDHE